MNKSKNKRRPAIPTSVKTKLWLVSGGRCQYEGCNTPLWRDDLDYKEMNTSYIAHIYGYAEDSARYDKALSPKLEKDFSNLMLMCDTHHRKIDNKTTRGDYPAERLIKMKSDHERRIEYLTGIKPERRSHVVLFGARIGTHHSPLTLSFAQEAMLPLFYPASTSPIELGLRNSFFEDSDYNYWSIEAANLEMQFNQKVLALKSTHEVQHYSIFALAPQPLLIKLGTLLNDIFPAEVYQLRREPSTWAWGSEDKTVRHQLIEASIRSQTVALKFELSATISDQRVENVLGKDCSIWSLTHCNPNNDYIKCKADLLDFRRIMRSAFDRIKSIHGQNTTLHVFPAMPLSTAVELGRIWMPKADLPMVIYDQNRKWNGFFRTLTITT